MSELCTQAATREWHAGFVDGAVFALFVAFFFIGCALSYALTEIHRGGAMSRPLTWAERRARLLDQVHERVRVQRNNLVRAGYRLLPAEARFDFRCGHDGCEKAYGHAGAHGSQKPEASP